MSHSCPVSVKNLNSFLAKPTKNAIDGVKSHHTSFAFVSCVLTLHMFQVDSLSFLSQFFELELRVSLLVTQLPTGLINSTVMLHKKFYLNI